MLDERKKKKKEEEEERRWTKSNFSSLVFSTLLNVSGVFRVDLAIEWQSDVVCRIFSLLCFVFLGVATCKKNVQFLLCTTVSHFYPNIPGLLKEWPFGINAVAHVCMLCTEWCCSRELSRRSVTLKYTRWKFEIVLLLKYNTSLSYCIITTTKYRYWRLTIDTRLKQGWRSLHGLLVYRSMWGANLKTRLSSNTLNHTNWKEDKTDLYLYGTEIVTSGNTKNDNLTNNENVTATLSV